MLLLTLDDQIHQFGIQLAIVDLPRALFRLFELFSLNIAGNCVLVLPQLFVEVSSILEFFDLLESLANKQHDLWRSLLIERRR